MEKNIIPEIPKKERKLWSKERRDTIQSLFMLFGVVALIMVASSLFQLDEARIYIERAGIWAPLVLILLKAGTIVFAPVSGAPLYPIAGAFFGPYYGTLYIFAGDLIGSTVSFIISRTLGRRIVDKFMADKSMVFVDAVLRYMGTIKGFIIARILFSPMPEVVSYAAGLTKMSFAPFIIIHSLIGLIPSTILVAFGASLNLAKGPYTLLLILIIGMAFAGIGAFIFFKIIQPKLIQEKEEILAEEKK